MTVVASVVSGSLRRTRVSRERMTVGGSVVSRSLRRTPTSELRAPRRRSLRRTRGRTSRRGRRLLPLGHCPLSADHCNARGNPRTSYAVAAGVTSER
jgi:hypothetical protein